MATKMDRVENQMEKLIIEFSAGRIITWDDFFVYTTRTSLARQIGVHPDRMKRIIANGDNATIGEVKQIAKIVKAGHFEVYKFIEQAGGSDTIVVNKGRSSR